ncbi:MAG TPA: Zn-dependent hydrolase [Methylomirabilota bacterium]|nr:Zn-dependent hydrolase [Methylomirabilota bacterium]
MASAWSKDLPAPSPERLAADLRALERFTRPDRPYTRRAFSDEDRAARAWLADAMATAGLAVTVDAAANVIGRRPGRPAGPALVLGSHLDTVEEGGRFDGIAGVLAALEVARCLEAGGRALARPLEVVNFTCEEPSDFGLSTIGSRAMSGTLDPATAARLTDAAGRTLAAAIDSVGGRAARLDEARRAPGTLAGYLELHIEQAPLLDRAGIPVGVVTAIAAPSRFRVTVRGRQDHAGGTSMDVRRDALAAAAEVVLAVERLARQAGRGMVGTVGALDVRPNMVNIVPGQVRLLADFRGIDAKAIAETLGRFEAAVSEIAARREVAVEADAIVREQPLTISPPMVEHAVAAAEAVGVPYRRLTSGASHDANHMAALGPIGMLFVPCRDGRSHCPEEWAEPDHLAAGTRVLLELVLRLDALGEAA